MTEDPPIDSGRGEIEELHRQLAEMRAENERLRDLLGVGTRDEAVSPWEPTLFVDAGPPDEAAAAVVDRHSPREAKVALFRSLFVGREDVHALRWENPRTGRAGWSPAVRGGWANAKKPGREYLPFEVHQNLWTPDKLTLGRLEGCPIWELRGVGSRWSSRPRPRIV